MWTLHGLLRTRSAKKARLQETSSDYIEQRKEYKVWPNKSHIHLHNIKCNYFTCLLSIVVSRPVFVASHRGVIQECLVCTARHPAFIIDQPGVWQQYRFSKLKTQNSITCRSSHKHASVYWRFMHQHTKRTYLSADPLGGGEVSLQHSEMQTQIGAKDMQIHLHNSNQSELCDVNSSWSA